MSKLDEELRKEFRKLNMRILFKKLVSPEKLDKLLEQYSRGVMQ